MTTHTAPVRRARASRRARVRGFALDCATLVAWVAAAAVMALAFLFARTAAGRAGVSAGDGALAAAFVGAAIPAWTAWLAQRLRAHGATPGEARAGLRVVWRQPARDEGDPREGQHRTAPWRPVLSRLALHPLGVPAWGWLIVVAALTGARPLLLVAAIPLLAGVASTLCTVALWAGWPDRRAPHDLLSRSRLVAQ